MKLFVYALRDWSFENIAPVLRYFDYLRWNEAMGPLPDLRGYDLIITCEPHISGWRKLYRKIAGKRKAIALQQSLYWKGESNPHASWPFDKWCIWGEQAMDVCRRHGIESKSVITGNPRFDKFFGLQVEDRGYTLVLGSGDEVSIAKSFPELANFSGLIRFQPHPCMRANQCGGTEELIRYASRVIFRCTGAGIIAMLMDKPVMILRTPPFSWWSEETYKKSKLYNIGEFGQDSDFVKWAVGGPGATERVKDFILKEA